MPWVHLHVNQNGRVSPCCNSNRYLGNVKDTAIQEIWEGDAFQQLREQFKHDVPDKRCTHCYRIEASDKKSLRQLTNEKYKEYLKLVDEGNPRPIYWDIRFSNICNFKCTTCWHGNSSSWFMANSKQNASDQRVIKAFADSFDELNTFIDDVTEIYFAGGEPLIMDEHYRVLEELDKRHLHHVNIRYNTNFSVLDYKGSHVLDWWKKFNQVHVSASIDAAFELGESIREGFVWEQFIQNRRRMIKETPQVYFEISPTVSNLNIHAIAPLHRYLVEEELLAVDHIYLNILERPNHYNMRTLTDAQKQQAVEDIEEHLAWLTQFNAKKTTLEEFRGLMSYLLILSKA